MHRLVALAAFTAALTAPAAARAQYLDPAPHRPHNWAGVDLGAGWLAGQPNLGHGPEAVLQGEAYTRISRTFALELQGSMAVPPGERDTFACALAPSAPAGFTCTSPEYLNTLGLSLGLARIWDQHDGAFPSTTFDVGIGAYRDDGLQSPSGTRFGASAALERTLFTRGHSAVTLNVRALMLPNTPIGRLWLLPVTLGLRGW